MVNTQSLLAGLLQQTAFLQTPRLSLFLGADRATFQGVWSLAHSVS